MSSRRPRPVADLLVGAVPQLRERLVEHRLRQAWATLVGRDGARRARPDSLKDGCLLVVADNSPWLQELTLRAPDLLARLQQEFPEVQALRFTVGTVDADSRPAGRRDRAPAPPALTDAEVREIDESTSLIPQPELATAARRLMVKAWRFSNARGVAR
jgi:predicted nucleic acid-binding Zn ribbon protein